MRLTKPYRIFFDKRDRLWRVKAYTGDAWVVVTGCIFETRQAARDWAQWNYRWRK